MKAVCCARVLFNFNYQYIVEEYIVPESTLKINICKIYPLLQSSNFNCPKKGLRNVSYQGERSEKL